MISVTVMEPGAGGKVLASQTQTIEPAVEPHTLTFHFEPALTLAPAREYLVIIDNTTAGQSITMNGMLNLRTVDDRVETVVPYPVRLIYPGNPYLAMADVKQDGILTEIFIKDDFFTRDKIKLAFVSAFFCIAGVGLLARLRLRCFNLPVLKNLVNNFSGLLFHFAPGSA